MSNVSKTRERILKAAASLFETQGIRSVTVDSISANAGVTKRTLYYHFRSKDDLIAAALTQHKYSEQLTDSVVAGETETPIEDVLSEIFAAIALGAKKARWTGFAFTQVAVELAGSPGHPAVVAARKRQSQLERLLAQNLEKLQMIEANRLARRLVILMDGAIAHTVIHHDSMYADEALQMALEAIRQGRRIRSCA